MADDPDFSDIKPEMSKEMHPAAEQALKTLKIEKRFFNWVRKEIVEVRKALGAFIITFALAALIGYGIAAYFKNSEIESYKERAERSDRDYKSQGNIISAQRAEADQKNRKLAEFASPPALKEAFKNPLQGFEIITGDISNRLSQLEKMQSPDEFAVFINGIEITNIVTPNEQVFAEKLAALDLKDRKFLISARNLGDYPIQSLEIRFSSFHLNETNVLLNLGAWPYSGTIPLSYKGEKKGRRGVGVPHAGTPSKTRYIPY